MADQPLDLHAVEAIAANQMVVPWQCDGCGCSCEDESAPPKDWATVTVVVADSAGSKYVLCGRYCPRCKGKDWAYRGHLTVPERLTVTALLAHCRALRAAL